VPGKREDGWSFHNEGKMEFGVLTYWKLELQKEKKSGIVSESLLLEKKKGGEAELTRKPEIVKRTTMVGVGPFRTD